MGDRNNPIKFGPEWLRNMAREHTEGGDRNAGAGSSGGQSPASSPPAPPPLNSNSPQANPTTITSKILLAKLRYGREELLALYDDTAEAPPELKQIDGLYQSRGKAPCALNNTFEEETRENMRSAPPIGSMSPADRFISARAATRGMSDVRVKTRGTFVRQLATGRGSSGWHAGARMPIFNTGTDDTNPVRSWTNNNTPPALNRNSGEPDWSTKVYRNKRQGNSTNWRQQQSREEGEEWRGEPGRHRDRDWGERNQPDKLPSWSSNRRTWIGGDSQNNDDLPEWAVENAEACGGTFDSAGAFHGYSHDDSNIPKNQESAHPLARSHTHGSFARSKAVEEGFEELPDKAKKLSTTKKFDQSSAGGAEKSNNEGDHNSAIGSDLQYVPEKLAEAASGPPEPAENNTSEKKEEKIAKKDNTPFKSKQKFTESHMFDAMMRSDINMEETSDDRGNFQSVMINPNNSLRQKHQNIVSPGSENANRQSRKSDVMQMGPNLADIEPPPAPTIKSPEDIVDDMFDLTLESKDMLLQKLPMPSNISNSGMAPGLSQPGNPMSQMSPMSNLGLRMASPGLGANHSMVMNSLANTSIMPPPIIQSHAMQSVGITNSALNASLGLSLGPNLMSIQSIRPPNIPSSSIGMQPGLHSGLQSSLQSGLQPGLQSTLQSLQSQSAMHHNMPPPNMPPNMQSNLQSSLQSTMQSTLQLNIQSNMQNNMQSLQGGMPSSMQSNMPPHMQSHMQQSHVQPNMLSNMPPNMQPNMQSHVQPNMQSNMPPNMQPIMQPIQSGLQGGPTGMPSFQSAGNLQGMPNSVGNNSLFLTQNSNNNENMQMPNLNDIPMPNHRAVGQGSIFPSHGLHSGAPPFGSSMYGNIMQQNPGAGPSGPTNLADQWYYEDPKKTIQGPFSSKDMFNWYRAGFFCPNLMVRRACDAMMRPLGSYGPVVPFAQMDMLPPFPMAGGFEARSQPSHDNMLNSQQSMGLDVRHLPPMANASSMEPIHFGSVRLLRSPPYGLPSPMVDSLWAQPPPSNELMWMQQAMNTQQRNENRVNNLPVFFWDQQPSAITSNSLLPEEIAKEMKTEDQILAQLRASQNTNTSQSIPFLDKTSTVPPANPETDYQPSTTSATPNLEELHKLIQKDTLIKTETVDETSDDGEPQTRIKTDKSNSSNVQATSESATVKQASQQNKATEAKPAKKSDNVDKSTKNKENNNTKNKNRKAKEEKKDDVPEVKPKDEEVKAEKRSKESSPSKTKKDEKVNKKDLEKEKKEWIKEGFTIVKGSEKTSSKENKKKTDDVKVAEEAERKRKEEENLAADDDKKKKQADDVIKKQQEMHPQQHPRPMVVESVVKKAPWSVGANHAMQATTREGPTLAEIQRLEREKKLEQMKEQQHMMHIIAQQHAAAMAREQEMQAGLGWAKKKMQGVTPPGQSLAEIQAEARKQAVAAAMVAASQQQLEELQAAPPPLANHVPWGTTHNGAFRPIGFWDNPANQPKAEKEVPIKAVEQKPKKKPIAAPIPPAVAGASGMCSAAAKKEDSPTLEFEEWCTTVLTLWSSTIDVPTFIAFLKDIESPYEVKDYVKCYLGEAKDANDFARQFLERRSKLLRVGMDTPSDDLCSPAMAVNPRTLSNSDYQEVKGKGKKTKKNKMMKVDANILGFSVTASEDRINVGDIDTA